MDTAFDIQVLRACFYVCMYIYLISCNNIILFIESVRASNEKSPDHLQSHVVYEATVLERKL